MDFLLFPLITPIGNPPRELTELTGKWKSLAERGFFCRLMDNDEHATAILDINACIKASLDRFEVGSNRVILDTWHAKKNLIWYSLLGILSGRYSLGKR